MSNHSGSCSLLIRAFEELLPTKGDSIFKDPHVGTDDECFRNVVSQLVNRATIEFQLSVEYAIICQQIAEIFDPVPGEKKTGNQFKYILTNQLQQNFVSTRRGSQIFKNHDEHKKLLEEINFEEDFATRTRLRKELEARLKTRQRSIGTVKLIAELFNVELINCRVMDLCMRDLLCGSQEPTELDIECFYILMTVTGAKLECLQAGKQVVEKYLSRLESIIDADPVKYGMRTRFLMLEIFQCRANAWNSTDMLKRSQNQPPQPVKVPAPVPTPVKNRLLEEVKASRILFQELNDVLYYLGPDELVQFVEHFRAIKFQSKDQLEGAVKIIFERVLSAPNMLSLYALVCRGLAGVSAPPASGSEERNVTFEVLLQSLFQNEIEKQQQYSPTLRQISNKIITLRGEKNAINASKLKEEVENSFKVQARVHRFTVFMGEVYNAELIGNQFIFEYISRLLDSDTISSTSVESFCFLIQTVDRKLLQDPYNIDLFKRSLSNLSKAMKTVQFAHRTQFMVNDLLDKCRVQLKILSDAGLIREFSGYTRCDIPWNSTLVEDPLWPEGLDKVDGIPAQQTNGQFVSPPRGPFPRELIHLLPPPPMNQPPPNHQTAKQKTNNQIFKTGNMMRAKSHNSLVPVDFSKGRVNPTMIKKNRKRSP